MPCILYIETATEVCSVSVAQYDKVIYNRIGTKGSSHAVLLGTFVNDAVIEMRLRRIHIDAVAVSCGPGSYTGLRIGVSEAKGLCYGLNIPLIAIETLKIMASGVLTKGLVGNDSLLCPMIDARRMEVYDAIFGHKLDVVRPIKADIIDEASFSEILSKQEITFFGNGAAKCNQVLQSANAIFLENVYPQATDMVPLALEAYKNSDFVDVAYFEPFYLKEFIATVAKNKVLPPH